MSKINVGLVQMSCTGDKAANLRKAIEQTRAAAARGAQIVTDLWILLIALFSPLLWFIAYTGKKKPGGKLLIPWLIIYTSIWIWIATSAEHRFGSAYLSLAIVLPLLYLAQGKRATGKLQNMMTPIFFTLFSGYYLYTGIHQHRACLEDRNYGFTLHKNWLLPLQNYRSTINNNLADFPYKTLNSGVRLYLSDSSHDCLNAPLPCMSWRYGEIEMRGSRMDKGFRNVKNEVKKYYPFIK